MKTTATLAPLALCIVVLGFLQLYAGETQPVAPDKKAWDAVAGKAAKFLKGTQDKNGGWSTDKSPGVTGVALTGLLKSGQATVKDPVAAKALEYIESLVNK